MSRLLSSFPLFLIAFTAVVATCPTARANDLEAGFRDPPHSAGIRCFWWWLNGNVTKEAITRDLEEMRAKGFNGALIFDADGSSQQGNSRAPAGPAFASPEWTALFVHACREAKRLELELSLNIQSGWNLGGPKVTEEQATQQLLWSKTPVEGPATVEQILPVAKTGKFYRDVAVIAVPLAKPTRGSNDGAAEMTKCVTRASSSQPGFPPQRTMDRNQDTFWVSQDPPDPEKPQWLDLTFAKPIKLSELSLLGRRGYAPREGRIQLSTDDKTYHTVTEFVLKDGEQLQAEFAPQQAKSVRVLFTSAYDAKPVGGRARNVQVTEITIPGVIIESAPNGPPMHPVKDLALKSSTRELGMSAPDCRFLLESAPALPGEAAVKPGGILNLSDKMAADGTLRWQAPPGDWLLLRIGHSATSAHVSTHSEGWGGRVLDYLDPSALEAYWDRNIEPLMAAIGPLAGTTLRYVHTDSWEGGGMNWTPGLDQTFRDNRGYDPLPWLAVLAGHIVDSRTASNAFLADFRKTIGDLVANHYAHLAKLAARHGMATHPECSGPHAGPLDGLKNYGRSELVMSEFWSPSPHRPTPDRRFFVKQASSAAHTYGKRLVGAEAFTTIGPHWNDVPWSAMKPSADHEFCAGLNLVFVHTFTCSPKEMGLPGQEYFAGTHFNPQLTWWDEAPAFIDYLRRCQYLAQQGDFVADVLHYYGDHIPNVFGRKGHDPAGALPGYDYDVLCEELLLDRLSVNDGRLTLPSGMSYRVLTLPDHGVLSLGAIRKLDALVRAGATVIGPKPKSAVSLEGGAEGNQLFRNLADALWGTGDHDHDATGIRKSGTGRVAWGISARDFLRNDGVAPDLELTLADGSPAPATDWIHYRIGDAELFFLAELGGKARNIEATFRVSNRLPELWDAVDGSVREAGTFTITDGRTRLPLTLGAYDSLFVVFRKPTPEKSRSTGPNILAWKDSQIITSPWEVTFDPGRGGPDKPVRFNQLTDWTAHETPAIRHYSGRAIYRTTFKIDQDLPNTHLALALGEVRGVGIARVKLNDSDLGITWRPPFRVNVGDALKPGANTLEVTIVNSWHNRVMADDPLPAERRFTKTNIRAQKNGRFQWQPESSGLLGPVSLQVGND